MRRLFLWGPIVFILLSFAVIAWAKDLKAPPPLRDIEVSQRKFLQSVYDNFNNLEVVESSPNGSRNGDYGDIIFYNNSGTWKLCVQTTEQGGTTWVCSGAYSTP
jgi:hypothetical protein